MKGKKKVKQVKKKIASINNSSPWVIGKKYFIRTVTMYNVGELVLTTEKELVLKNAAWVADTGRFSDALRTGCLNEVEPFVNDIIINRDAIIDATEWTHALPREQK